VGGPPAVPAPGEPMPPTPSTERRPPGGGRTRTVRQLPEPVRFWIAHGPRSWRCAGGLWSDLANGRLEGLGRATAELPELEADVDDLFYLPQVAPELAGVRDRLAASLIEAGTPVLVQLRPGERPELPGAEVIYDLLDALLGDELASLGAVPAGANTVWPLIPGITDHPELWDEGLERLAAAGVRRVQGLALELGPRARRRLAEGREEHVFDALFHGSVPSERGFARHVARHGLEPFLPRPRTGVSPRRVNNRQIAARLALAGELWLRLGRPVNAGQALFRAARGAESTHHDLVGLAREKNLEVMDWLDKSAAEVVREIVLEGRSSLLEELRGEYLE